MDSNLRKQLQSILGTQVITTESALIFLQQIKKRSMGAIETPVLEYILSVNYLASPVNEYSEGYQKSFSTKGHKKAQGLDIELKTPISWKAKEGRRPHIVQKWTSENGTGFEMIQLGIRDAGGYTPSNKEVEEFISSGEPKGITPLGSVYIDSGVFSLEMRKGYWLEMYTLKERVGVKIYLHSVMHMFFFRGKAISLTCSASSSERDNKKADEAYKRITPLCQRVLNSIVLLQAY